MKKVILFAGAFCSALMISCVSEDVDEIPCEKVTDCEPGWQCIDNVCVEPQTSVPDSNNGSGDGSGNPDSADKTDNSGNTGNENDQRPDSTGGTDNTFPDSDTGQTNNGDNTADPEVATVKLLTTGSQHACALKDSGQLYCWGLGGRGQIGNGQKPGGDTAFPTPYKVTEDAWKMVHAIGDATCALKKNGQAFCWGLNQNGEMANGLGGADQNTAAYATPQEILSGANPNSYDTLFAGGSNTIFGYSNGTLYGWGLNNTGQLCNGQIGYDASYEGGSATVYHARILNGDTSIWPNFKRIVPARSHVCALSEDNSLYCWGSYDYAQFGDGQKGDGLDSMRQGNTAAFSEYHAPKKIGEDKWVDIAAMDKNTCGIKEDGTLWCWGNAEWGVLGGGKVFKSFTQSAFEYEDNWKAKIQSGECISRFESTSIKGDLKGQKTTYPTTCLVPQQIGTESNWAQLSGKSSHICAVNGNNELFCWGENEYGQIGNGTAPSEPYSTLPSNYDLQADPYKVGDDYIFAAAGGNFTCALKKDKTVWCWGRGVVGATGTVSKNPVTQPRQLFF